MTDMPFEQKRILITGSSRGIGLASARHFVDRGARVVVNGRSQETVDAALATLAGGDRATDVTGVVADVSRVASCEAMVAEAVATLGGLDVLVTAAGVAYDCSIDEVTEEIWDRTLDINLKGLFFTGQAALPALRESHGTIVNVASDSGVRGEKELSVYCASKAAVINLTRAMALETAPQVRVNCVCPGYVDTDMIRRDFIDRSNDPAAAEAMLEEVAPLRRMARPEEIAAAIGYLAGEDAGFITGAALSIDGGTTIG
jgi:NAD(P)-dependent dehydrogenase (short-subunit alcohol dehydrogenase family)